MSVLELVDLPAALPPMTPVVGLDLGEKTVGVAVSDLTRMIASPLALIGRTKFTADAERLFVLMQERGANMILEKGAVLDASDSRFDITPAAVSLLNQKLPSYKVQLVMPPPGTQMQQRCRHGGPPLLPQARAFPVSRDRSGGRGRFAGWGGRGKAGR